MTIDHANHVAALRIDRTKQFNQESIEIKFLKLAAIRARKMNDEYPLAINIKNPKDNFDSIVFQLISKAQSTPDNYYRLRLGFPEYVELWEEWQAAENEEDFFKKYGVK